MCNKDLWAYSFSFPLPQQVTIIQRKKCEDIHSLAPFPVLSHYSLVP